ncbi:MAG: aldo/keto reductase [Eubacterium sp.]|nr:aldo/keto reductase [Eubacterium sp.]
MQYRNDRNGNPISILGFGCMRFTTNGKQIDIDKAEKELITAIDAGVNYLDTAYIYNGSEVALGEILTRSNLRDRVNLATKLPQYMVKSEKAIDKYFDEQLSRLKTDHIEYYLMHMLTDLKSWQNLKNLGIEKWILEKKASGAIKNIGFSFHGNTDTFISILNDYDWDFCQIQYNYLDNVSQAGERGLKAAAAKGIPVIIMEPLRGGKLVNMLPEAAKNRIEADTKKRTPAELALKWLWNQPEITCVLSGMNSVKMVEENCRIASEVEIGEFDESDHELIESIREDIRKSTKVGCTACGYCMPCPQGVDIPTAFRYYNESAISGKSSARFEYAQAMGLRVQKNFPSQCVACGKCMKHCPQGIDIINELKNANKVLRPLPYRIGTAAARAYMLRGKKKKADKADEPN